MDYARRCIKCRHHARIQLPILQKKVVYLDQLVVSNIAKSLMHKREDRWLLLFRQLHRLVNAQLFICPDSDIHFFESSVSPHNNAFKRIYKHLSGGIGLYDTETVLQFQLCMAFDQYAKLTPASAGEITLAEITHGDANGWQDVLTFVPNIELTETDLTALRADRDQIEIKMAATFARWQSETRSFKEYFVEETDSLGPGILEARKQSRAEIISAAKAGVVSPDLLFHSSRAEDLYSAIRHRLPDDDEVAWSNSKVDSFLMSKHLRDIPYVRISSAIYAWLARLANNGRKQLPTRGLANDVRAISAYLPYVDAMFIDKEMRQILESKDVRQCIGAATLLFSFAVCDSFMEYLERIVKKVPPSHWETLADVYGPGHLDRFDSILDNVARR